MAGLLDRIEREVTKLTLSSVGQSASFAQPPHQVVPLGALEPFGVSTGGSRESVPVDFDDYVEDIYKRNGIVFACIAARMLPFSEARFQFQELRAGRPGRLFGDPSLSLLETPWANATTGDLLARMEQRASLAGNYFATTVGQGDRRRLRELRPDWMTVVSGVRDRPDASPFELDAEILGYIYHPKNVRPAVDPVFLTPERVVHYAPIPDPNAQWRGMSWLTPVLDEIASDAYATRHKRNFYEKGASLNLAITYDKTIPATDYERYVQLFDERHAGVANAYKTIHLGGGADAKMLSTDLRSIDFKAVQGAGETRIAAASGVGAIIARFSEGMQGSSLNAGNYGAAKRQFADMTLRPLWRNAAGSLARLVPPPNPASRLWYDARDVEFLKEDRKDASAILQQNATTVRALVDAGYHPDAVIDAVEAGDLSRLAGQHSGLFSVQLQAAGAGDPTAQLAPAELAALFQKIYLAVQAGVITVEEARAIANRAGANLPPAPPTGGQP